MAIEKYGGQPTIGVLILDGDGNPITSFGGGTQYTEGATDASITGTAILMEDAGDTLTPVPGTAAGGLLVDLGGNNDVTVTGSVTANAGTNLNTSALALESGGNLAAAAASLATLDNIVAGSEAQVDVVAALPAGTNNIGDVDVLTAINTDFEHGSNLDVDTGAEQLPSAAAKFGVIVKAARANTANIYVGKSDVTAGTTDATDGFELGPGESVMVPVNNANLIYVIAAANNQDVFWLAV